MKKRGAFRLRNLVLKLFRLKLESTLEKASFDCITLWHVLEHFSDLHNYIAEINRLLKPGGICIIAVPNIDSYDARHFGQYWAAFDVPGTSGTSIPTL